MPASAISSENVPSISPQCPTCGKEMTLTGVTPTCESVIYEYLCSNDGDHVSWRRPHHAKKRATQDGEIVSAAVMLHHAPARRRVSEPQ
jgi:hypothetical protein